MKPIPYIAVLTFCLLIQSAFGQGTIFVYDQQSSTRETNLFGLAPINVSGQSFTPSLSGVGFVRLYLADTNTANGIGATLYLNLRSGSITGSVLSATSPVFMANGFAGVTNFIFPNTVSVTPGTTYYFEAVNQAGDSFLAAAGEYFYEGGYAYYNGVLNGGGDLWFREGIIVPAPEPGTLWLGVLGAGLLWAVRRKRKVEN